MNTLVDETTMMRFVPDVLEDGWRWGEEYHVAGGQLTLRMRQRFSNHEHWSVAERERLIRFSMKNIELARTKLDKEHKRLDFIIQKVQQHCDHQWSNGMEGTE